MKIKNNIVNLLRWSEKYTNTDMIYVSKGGFWLTLGKVGVFIISFLTMVAFARWLPQETYGTYQYVLATVGMLAVFALPGINTFFIRGIARHKDGTLGLAVVTKIKWALVGSAGILGIGGWYFINDNPTLAILFLIGALFMPFHQAFHLFSLYWNGKRQFNLNAKYRFGAEALAGAVVIGALYFTNNIIAIILLFFLAHSLFQGIFLKIAFSKTENQEADRESVAFGKSLTVMGAFRTITKEIDKIIIWNFLGPASVAVYSFARLPISKISQLNFIPSLALPKLSARDFRREKEKRNLLKKFYKLFLFFIPASLAAIIAAPFLYRIFFPQYLESIPYFQALGVILALLPFSLLEAALTTELRKKELYIIKFTEPTIQIILFLILGWLYGVWGIVLTLLIAKIISGTMTLYFFKRLK